MEARDLLRSQFQQMHQFVEMTVADCADEALNARGDGWTINPIGALYAHLILAEDAMVNGRARGGETLLVSEGWGEKIGISDASSRQSESWSDFKADLPALRSYAAAVAAATDDFLATASDADLLREVDAPGGGTQPVITFLANIGVTHIAGHWGEIAALKGVQGLKGLPF